MPHTQNTEAGEF